MLKRKKRPSYFEESLTEEQKLDRTIERKPKLTKKLKHDAFIKVFGTILVFFITFTFIFGITTAPTNDMFPAIHEGDVILYFRLGPLANTDVAVYETDEGKNIGRVEAVAGSEIGKTEGGLLTIQGNLQPIQKEAGLYYKTYIRENGKMKYPSVVPEDSYLVLAECRTKGKDSRDYGFIARDQIKGKVFTIMRRRPL